MSKKKRTYTPEQLEAKRARNRKYYRENKSVFAERYQENREDLLAARAADRRANPEKYRERDRDYNTNRRKKQ